MLDQVIKELHRVGAIKFGEFKLKSGVISPVYVDLRLMVSYPKLLQMISDLMWEKVKGLDCDLLCGVPYTALPVATALSLDHDIPMVMRRKEAKAYGTKKIIEGAFTPGDRCLIIEDVVTSGMSIFETIRPLEEAGLIVEDIVVFVDREQGGRAKIEEQGYRLHSVLTLSDLLAANHTQE